MKNTIQEHSKKILVPIILIICAVVIIAEIINIVLSNDERIYAKVHHRNIEITNIDDEYYLFLPSYAQMDKVKIHDGISHLDINILKSENLPTIYIDTSSKSLDNIYADKEHSEPGNIEIIDVNGQRLYKEQFAALSGHGNYTWTSEVWEKKPFNLELNKPDSLLGLGKGNKYVLIANASDPTLIRNDIARGMEVALDLPYSHQGVFADLYINGGYMGVYYLCPRIEVGEERVNITNLQAKMDQIYSKTGYDGFDVDETVEYKARALPIEPEDITGGYIIEREFNERYMVEYPDIKSGFMIDSGEDFVVKSPRYCSFNEIQYIRNLVNDIDKCLSSPDGINPETEHHFSELIDMQSFADRYLVEEVSKNYDSGNSSSYFYKDSDSADTKLYYGPGWDYDMTFGSYQDWMNYENPLGLTYGQAGEHCNQWIKQLYGYDDFMKRVRVDYYAKLLPYMENLVESEIDEYMVQMDAALTMDLTRWSSMYKKCGYEVGSDASYEELKQFITARTEYLSRQW